MREWEGKHGNNIEGLTSFVKKESEKEWRNEKRRKNNSL
jgi:hypothetical protein